MYACVYKHMYLEDAKWVKQIYILLHWQPTFYFLSFSKILFIYLRDRDRHTARAGGGQRGRERQTSPLSMEPNSGLDPRTLRS